MQYQFLETEEIERKINFYEKLECKLHLILNSRLTIEEYLEEISLKLAKFNQDLEKFQLKDLQ